MKQIIVLITWLISCHMAFAQKTPSILLEIEVPDTIYSNCINGVAKFTNTGSVTIMVNKFLCDCDNRLLSPTNWDFIILNDSIDFENEIVVVLPSYMEIPAIKLKPSHTISIPFDIPFNPEINSERVLNGTFSLQLSYKIRESSYSKKSWRKKMKKYSYLNNSWRMKKKDHYSLYNTLETAFLKMMEESNDYTCSSNTENFVFLISE